MNIDEMTFNDIFEHLKTRYPALVVGICIPIDEEIDETQTLVHGPMATCIGLARLIERHVLKRL
jgi:hypothetical protein